MSSLFWKGMVAFLIVILVAIGTVAVLTARATETAFRRYTLTRGVLWEAVTSELAAYYGAQDSWTGIQEALIVSPDRQHGMWGRGATDHPMRQVDFRIVDAEGRVVATTQGSPRGSVSRTAFETAVPIEVDGAIVGHLLPAMRPTPTWPLDTAQAAFLDQVNRMLWIGAAAAMAVALVVGGVLFRSITAPLRELTAASEAIARGDLSARAHAHGDDEVAQLADAFNSMAGSLAQMEEARRNQSADIAHELRTPLTMLQGTLEAMLDEVYPADPETLEAALTQTRTLSRLIEDLRVVALVDAGMLHLERDALDLARFLKAVVDAYQPQAREQGVALTLANPSALPVVTADRDRLTQVMGNLLTNSLHYVLEGGQVRVHAECGDGEVLLWVEDDGPGVSPEDLAHLFERFWRADPARRRATGGSGLGLSIARYIVEAHGGRMWAQETPGGGLTVTFSVPLAASHGHG